MRYGCCRAARGIWHTGRAPPGAPAAATDVQRHGRGAAPQTLLDHRQGVWRGEGHQHDPGRGQVSALGLQCLGNAGQGVRAPHAARPGEKMRPGRPLRAQGPERSAARAAVMGGRASRGSGPRCLQRPCRARDPRPVPRTLNPKPCRWVSYRLYLRARDYFDRQQPREKRILGGRRATAFGFELRQTCLMLLISRA